MTSQAGSKVLLKVGDNGSPETFITIGGLLLTSFNHHNALRDVTTKDSNGWRELADFGTKAVSISGSGRFEDSAAEALVRGNAMNGYIRNYQITFGNGDVLSGAFQISNYQRGGNNSSIEVYSLSLSSSGSITYIAA